MSFRSLLEKAKGSAEVFIDHHRGQDQARPPPIPPNKPRPSNVTPYWAANFDDSTTIAEHFQHELGDHGWGNNELQNYSADPLNSFHRDGRLVLRAIASQGRYSSARLKSRTLLGRQRGSLVVHAEPPCANGIWPAFWLLPSDPFEWPNEGEVDIIETWNGDRMNHSCLHWGHYNGEDYDKHRVIETHMADMSRGIHAYEFAWEQPENGQGGKMVWYIDGRAVMKASIPQGTRRMSDWMIIINVAMGGNVCQGKRPADGQYDFVIQSLRLSEEPNSGWQAFQRDCQAAPEGHMM